MKFHKYILRKHCSFCERISCKKHSRIEKLIKMFLFCILATLSLASSVFGGVYTNHGYGAGHYYAPNPSVNCRKYESAPGVFNFDCSNIDPEEITLSKSHDIWLKPKTQPAYINIPIKNYKNKEHITAAIKPVPPIKTKVNVFLERPWTKYDVQVAESPVIETIPYVNVQYEKPHPPKVFHYPAYGSNENQYHHQPQPQQHYGGPVYSRRSVPAFHSHGSAHGYSTTPVNTFHGNYAFNSLHSLNHQPSFYSF